MFSFSELVSGKAIRCLLWKVRPKRWRQGQLGQKRIFPSFCWRQLQFLSDFRLTLETQVVTWYCWLQFSPEKQFFFLHVYLCKSYLILESDVWGHSSCESNSLCSESFRVQGGLTNGLTSILPSGMTNVICWQSSLTSSLMCAAYWPSLLRLMVFLFKTATPGSSSGS